VIIRQTQTADWREDQSGPERLAGQAPKGGRLMAVGRWGFARCSRAYKCKSARPALGFALPAARSMRSFRQDQPEEASRTRVEARDDTLTHAEVTEEYG